MSNKTYKLFASEILTFDLNGKNVPNSEFDIECSFELSTQTPVDTSLHKRAIFINFQANSVDKKFHLGITCRVIFTFDKIEDLLDDREFLKLYREEAIKEMNDKANNALRALGLNVMNIPIHFED